MARTSLSLGRGESVSGALLVFFLALIGPPDAGAETDDALVRPGDVQSGSLLLETVDAGRYLEAPRLATDVSVTVTGPIARTRVTQRFENPSGGWVEGVYVFPLPPGSAVDTLRMQVGERFLEGDVQERARAKEIYERAAAQGFKATLIEQDRPNLFRSSVANIGPREAVIVQIEYQEAIRLDGDELSLRVPLVVAPRFAPAPTPDADPVPDRERITVAARAPSDDASNPVTLAVRLEPGVPLATIESPSHDVQIERARDGSASVTLRGPAPADRDFVLRWKLAASESPRAALFRETVGDSTYYLALIVPPLGTSTPRRQPRETIFVVDDSGSMAGESMEQAQAALLQGLRALAPGDRFNVIRFDDGVSSLHPAPVSADAANVAKAERFVANLRADGGTAIHPALVAALRDATPYDDAHLRQVLFLTDGAVGNEDQVLAEIGRSLGRTRLFTVAIGSAPNSYLMEHIARLGRGTFTHIGSTREVAARMKELLDKLESPVMTSLRVESDDAGLEVWPNPVPDLYAGEPVVLTAMTRRRESSLGIEGRIGEGAWSATLSLDAAREGAGVAKLWARAKIAAVEEMRFSGVDPGDIDAEVLRVALQHHLVSRRTSLVAVDVTPSRTHGEALTTQAVPLQLPHGWDFGSAGREAPEGRSAPALDPRRVAKLAALDHAKADGCGCQGLSLPQTDAGTDLQLALGALLLLSGGLGLLRARRLAAQPC